MAQQINLYSPVLRHPQQRFSAQTMLVGLALLAVGLVALCAWSVLSTQDLKVELQAARQVDEQSKNRLTAELARRPAAVTDTKALEQELAQARLQLQARQALLAELAPADGGSEKRASALLRTLAQTVPAGLWLSEVRISEQRVEIAGQTLQPEVLRPWLARLAQHPALAGQQLQAVKVERSEAAAVAGPAESWVFRVVSARPGAGAGAAAGTPGGSTP